MIVKNVKQIKTAFVLLLILTLLTGFIYPLLVTGIAQLLFSHQANGNLLIQNNTVVGSTLIGQPFTDAKYFWGRPSATQPFPYNAANSAGSNLAPTNPALLTNVQNRVDKLKKLDPRNKTLIPVDLVTASASGLDPDISPAAAFYQINRIATVRKLPAEKIQFLVKSAIKKRFLGILGEPRVNVLELNLALDKLSTSES